MISNIDPKIDFAFKKLFAQEKNIALTVHFLNSVLNPNSGSEIVGLELLNPFSEKDSSDDKLSIVDVKARDFRGRYFDIEMQINSLPCFPERILYYWAALHQQQLKAGNAYTLTRPTISISVMDFSLFPKVDEYRLGFDLRNSEYNIVFSTDLQVITLELPKFTVSLPQIQSPLERWLYFFRYGHTIDTGNIPKELDTPEIREALEELKMLSHDDLERERYLARVRVLRDEKTLLLYAAESHDKGMEKGMEKGIQQGIQQGIQRGIEKGKAQLICVQLQKRFNSLDSNLQTQVETLDGDLLDALAGAIFEFKNVGDLREWLRREASAT